MNNSETLATLGTHNKTEWTIQKHWQHWVNTTKKNVQSRITGNIGYTRHRGMDNPETLARLGKHDTEEWTIQKHWQH
jgi:hypothetical protein